jgi:fucose 4-O-acetylase-like acetyltransferase
MSIPHQLRPEWSRKMRFFSFVSMVLLVYVHGYDLQDRYLQPFSFVFEKMTLTAFAEHFTANGLFRFRIPMLFAISGFLLARADDKGYLKMIGKRFRTLFLPYLLWSILGVLVAYGLYKWSFTHQAVANSTPKSPDDFSWRDWRDAILSNSVTYQLWFIRSLFFLNLLYPVLRMGVQKIPAILFIVVTILWIVTPVIGFPFVESEGLLPFCMGIWLCKRGKDLSKTPKWFSLNWFTIAFLSVILLKTWLAFHPFAIFKGEAGARISIMFLYKLTVAMGLLVAWFGSGRIADYFMRRSWFVKATDYAFIIYALHVPIVTFMIDPVHGLLGRFTHYRIITYAFLPVAIILFCMSIGVLLRYSMPPVYSILTGGRGLKPLVIPQSPDIATTVRVLSSDEPVVH